MKRTISDWQGRDPSDCEPDYSHDSDNTPDWQFFLGIFLLLGVMIGSFYLYQFLIGFLP